MHVGAPRAAESGLPRTGVQQRCAAMAARGRRFGGAAFRDAGKVHMLTNEGTTRYVNRLVELKALDEDTEV